MTDMFKFRLSAPEETPLAPDDSRLTEDLQQWVDAEVLAQPLVEDERTLADIEFLKANLALVEGSAHKLSHAFRHLFILSRYRLDLPRVRVQLTVHSRLTLAEICVLAKRSNLTQWTEHPSRFAGLLIMCKVRFRNALILWQKSGGR